jgi:hypothetical protein
MQMQMQMQTQAHGFPFEAKCSLTARRGMAVASDSG